MRHPGQDPRVTIHQGDSPLDNPRTLAPTRPDPILVDPVPVGRPVGKAREVRPIMRTEGPRGYSARAAIYLRYLSYFGLIVFCVLISQAALAAVPGTRGGAWVMLTFCAIQIATSCIGTFLYPHRRPELVEQFRHYVFGLTALPSTGIAVAMWLIKNVNDAPAGEEDVLLSTLSNAMIWFYYLPIIVPSIILIKMVSGMRGVERVQTDDQEMLNSLTRVDHLHR